MKRILPLCFLLYPCLSWAGISGTNSSTQTTWDHTDEVVVGQDTHCASTTERPYIALHNELARGYFSLWLSGGDCANGNFADSVGEASDAAEVKEWLDSLGVHNIRYFGTWGNHDADSQPSNTTDPWEGVRSTLPWNAGPLGNGSYYIDSGPARYIFIQNHMNVVGEVCSTATFQSDRIGPALTTDAVIFNPTSYYSGFAVSGNPEYQLLKTAIEGCLRPWCWVFFSQPIGPAIQGSSFTGDRCWGQYYPDSTRAATHFGNMLQNTRTGFADPQTGAYYGVDGVYQAHLHIVERRKPVRYGRTNLTGTSADSTIRWMTGPNVHFSHAGAIAAWDSVDGTATPDTVSSIWEAVYGGRREAVKWVPGSQIAYWNSTRTGQTGTAPVTQRIKYDEPSPGIYRVTRSMIDSSRVEIDHDSWTK